MKQITNLFGTGLVAMLIAASGCSPSHQPDSVTLQGTWKGQQADADAGDSPSIVFTGTNLEFRASTNEWYKATFTLHEDTNPRQLVVVITDCPFSQFVGKSANAIYRIENGTLTIAGNAPGNPAVPAAFDMPGARQLTFKAGKP
jgi:uncharacterized protein (TIGR03067 family)